MMKNQAAQPHYVPVRNGAVRPKAVPREYRAPIRFPLSIRAVSRVDGKGHRSMDIACNDALIAIVTLIDLSLEQAEGVKIEVKDATGRIVMNVSTETFGKGVQVDLMDMLRSQQKGEGNVNSHVEG